MIKVYVTIFLLMEPLRIANPYMLPSVVLVPEKDERIRLTVDYRKLNSSTLADKYLLPRTNHVDMDSLCHHKETVEIKKV